MKEIYSLLNDVETDIDSYCPQDLTDIEKTKLKEQIKKRIGKPEKNGKRKRYAAVAACVAVCVIALGTLNFSDLVYASAKSIAWQISNFLGIEKNLQDYTTVVGTSKTDKGYTIKLNEIILDENQLVVSSSVQSKQKLSEGGVIASADVYVNGKRVSVAAGGSSRALDDYTEESLLDYELEDIDTSSRLDIELVYTDILQGSKVTNGKWAFHFEADGSKLAEATVHKDLNNSFTLPDGSKLVLTEYTSNDLGQKIYFKVENWEYEKNPMYDLELEGKDDQGNKIIFDMSYFDGEEKTGRLNVRMIEGVVPESAKWVMLKPYAVKMPEKSGKMSHDFVEIGDSFTIKLSD
ncbi:DUF4179 domain-containing protein [Aminipila terrae]|uniref:DUF4179 domain-containing protein n=1 Tax=Aminipila terrae TaxID=2697030 RepID=A0A6P1MJL4_9FIRM|nr:DUF4179 domain-containing protein [Aminipila terrae]QHI72824.1 DUF4179 domain-containing protein [Aminipila terrae]